MNFQKISYEGDGVFQIAPLSFAIGQPSQHLGPVVQNLVSGQAILGMDQ